MIEIELIGGLKTRVDDDAYGFASYRWYAQHGRGSLTVYAKTIVGGRTLYLHRMMFDSIPAGLVVDHIDRDGLNNQRANLRLVTQGKNQRAWFKLEGWQHIHRTKARGRIYYYHRPTKTRLPDDPNSEEFTRAVDELNKNGTSAL